MPVPPQVRAGRIRYRIRFIPNPGYRRGSPGLFSDELQAEIRRLNVPDWRVVYFDGRRSRSEEINVDYGVSSPSFELRVAGDQTLTYCKAFPHFNFCLEHPILTPAGGPPPSLAPTGETANIAGLPSRKAEYRGPRRLYVWYTEALAVDDPTGAVLRLEGVPGLILQTEEIPLSEAEDVLQQVTVVEMDFDPPSPEIFSPPAEYRRFDSLDDARREERRMLAVEADEELRHRPLSDLEREMFVGSWLFKGPQDQIQVEIARTGENQFRFRTTVLTAPPGAPGRLSEERASMQARLLLVEDPPNYRLYQLEDGGQRLVQVGYELFTFTRL